MGLYLDSLGIEIICFLISTLLLLYWYLTKNYHYWENRRIPCKKAEFPFGSTKELALAKTYTGKAHDDIYKEFSKERFYGIIELREPALVLRDPELVKRIMVKDFNHFVDRPIIMGNPKEYIQLHLLNLVGQEWKDMRAKLTPTFTSGKMKLMFSLMEKCGERLKDRLEEEVKNQKVVDAKNILSRFTLDIIASCAFGLDTNSLTEENAQFFRIFGGVVKSTKIRFLRRMCFLFFPYVLKFLRVNFVRPQLRDFVRNIIEDTIEFRQKNNVKRNDFLDLLISVRQNKISWTENGVTTSGLKTTSTEGLTTEQMAAQTFVFIIAGFETASSLMSFCLYELSRHEEVQEKLYQELQEAVDKNDGKISYQLLMEVPYLDQVINETLRLYGSAHVLSRVCTQSYKVPDSQLVIEKGMKIIIPLFSLHHDPQYYPEPYEFRPERFTPEETRKRHPFVFMPFGEGPRNCIGMRFGLMQAKVGLATVMLNFQVQLSPDQEVPIEIDKLSAPLMPANPVLLKFCPRKYV